MKVLGTLVSRYFPTQPSGEEDRNVFDLWRLPNDPDSPHAEAMRDLFLETFGIAPTRFDASLEPEEGLYRRLIVAARKNVICAGILYHMADNRWTPIEEQVDGGYVSYIATRKKARSQGAGRTLLGLAEADFIVNGHTMSRLIRLDPRHTVFFQAAGYQPTEGGEYGDMHKTLDVSPPSIQAAQLTLNGLMTLY